MVKRIGDLKLGESVGYHGSLKWIGLYTYFAAAALKVKSLTMLVQLDSSSFETNNDLYTFQNQFRYAPCFDDSPGLELSSRLSSAQRSAASSASESVCGFGVCS